MSKKRLTKDEVLETIRNEQENVRRPSDMREGTYYRKVKQSAEDYAFEPLARVDKMRDAIDKYSTEIGISEARKLIAGLECLEYELRAKYKIVGYVFKAGEFLELDSACTITKQEKDRLKIYSKEINDTIKIAKSKQKKLANRKENGKKLGKGLEELADIASNMIREVEYKTPEQVIEETTGVSLSQSHRR